MGPFKYQALELVQQPGAPVCYVTAVPAGELLEWCDVPRAKGDYMAGYQRTLQDKRVEDLAAYLRLSPNNVVPGAVIVAVDSDHVAIQQTDGSAGVCSIEISEDTRDFQTKLEELWGHFTTRLADDEATSAGLTVIPGGSSDGAAVADADDTAEASEDGELPEDSEDVGAAEDVELIDEIDDTAPDDEDTIALFPSSYLASLTKELTDALQDWSQLTSPRQEAITSFIEGVSKPGLIIDGQHRVFGAKNVSEHDVVLPVVLLPGLAFAEQVFQFYVLNSKARPLKPTELRRIVSTSLTNAEIGSLYARFKAAGIDADEARWTLELDTSPKSPFRGRIDFGFGGEGTVIPENVADQVVRSFMKMPLSRYRQLITPLGDTWDNTEKRLQIFFWFWNAIKDVYADVWGEAEAEADEGRKHQLFMKVALLTLQQFVLDRFVTALPYRSESDAPPLSSEEEVGGMVRSTLTNLHGEFFRREWKLKQIDTSEGRKALYTAMDSVWNNQGKLHGNMALFKG
jgi:hypothetical protein